VLSFSLWRAPAPEPQRAALKPEPHHNRPHTIDTLRADRVGAYGDKSANAGIDALRPRRPL
jgi:hypothetical protein